MGNVNKEAERGNTFNPVLHPYFRAPLVDDVLESDDERARRFIVRILIGEAVCPPKELNAAMERAGATVEAIAARVIEDAWNTVRNGVTARLKDEVRS